MRATTRKRLEWLGVLAATALGFGLVLADSHGRKWSSKHPWKAAPSDARDLARSAGQEARA